MQLEILCQIIFEYLMINRIYILKFLDFFVSSPLSNNLVKFTINLIVLNSNICISFMSFLFSINTSILFFKILNHISIIIFKCEKSTNIMTKMIKSVEANRS